MNGELTLLIQLKKKGLCFKKKKKRSKWMKSTAKTYFAVDPEHKHAAAV